MRTSCGTFCYKSPEQQGMLPRGMATGSSYTTAVDLWALGVVIHEVLTSEIPFQDTYRDTCSSDQDTDITLTANLVPSLDTHMFYRYCQGDESFPIAALQKNQVDADGIVFVKSLMVVNPPERASATDALDSAWLAAIDPPEVNPTATGPELLRVEFKLLDITLSHQDATQLYVEENRSIILRMLSLSEAKATLIRSAITKGYVEVVKVLLKVNGHINDAKEDISLLELAASDDQVAVMQVLLNRGAFVNGPGGETRHTPLQAAAQGGHLAAINFLLAMGAYVDAPGPQSALEAAARGGHLDAVKILLNSGADVNMRPGGSPGNSALQAASERGDLEMMRILLNSGAKLNISVLSGHGSTALHAAT